MFKKRFLIIIIIVSLMLIVTSCDNKKHDHSYSDWITIDEATCEKEGIRIRRCLICGQELNREKIVKQEHQFINGKCRVCKTSDPLHEHSYQNGYCVCGLKHPNFGNCALDRDNELCLDQARWSWDYNKNNWDGKGMVIEIMAYPASEIDPYNRYYNGERKTEKQALINKIEAEYNIDIVYKDYPAVAPWGSERIKWITNGVTEGLDVGDIFVIDSSWIPQLQEKSAIAELYDLESKTGIFKEYNYVQDQNYNFMSSVNNKVYAYSNEYLLPDFWLHYNQDLIDKYDLPDPATLWNNNEWTWSTFVDLLAAAQKAFDNDLDNVKKWAFGGDYFTNAKGFVASRGGQFVKKDKVLLDDELVIKVYDDLQDIENLYWEPKGSTVSSVDFRDGLVLFQTGQMWFYGAAERWPTKLDFGISAVPYPRQDDDPDLKNYQIPVGYESMYAIRNITSEETGLTSSILFNILDDLSNGLKPEAFAASNKPKSIESEYYSYLEARLETTESVKAIMDIVFNHGDLIYLESIDLLSLLLSSPSSYGSAYSEYGLYGKSLSIITNEKQDPATQLSQIQPFYQAKLDELLNVNKQE